MDVHPIAATQVELVSFGRIVRKETNESPFTGLDMKRPDGFIKAIGRLSGNPDAAMFHYSCGFLGSLKAAHAEYVAASTRLEILRLKEGEDLYLVSGSIRVWRDACVLLSRHPATAIRIFANQCCERLRRAGFRSIWDSWAQRTNADGTYTLS